MRTFLIAVAFGLGLFTLLVMPFQAKPTKPRPIMEVYT